MAAREGTSPWTPFILDVEASGLGTDSYPIEIGVALEPGRRQAYLIAPLEEWTHWDPSAERLHGLSRRTIALHGRPVATIARLLNERLRGLTLYSDGWVVDRPWLTRLFHAARAPMSFELSPIERILSEAQMGLWDETKRAVERELAATRHRASHDAWIVQETWLRTRAALDGTAD